MSRPLEAEQSVLGSILIDAKPVLPIVRAKLKPSDFAMETNRVIYLAALELDRQGKPVDCVTVLNETGRGGDPVDRAYLLQLMDITPTAANVEQYIEIVRDAAVRRRTAEIGNRAAELSQTTDDPRQVLSNMVQSASDLMCEGSDQVLLSPNDQVMRFVERRDKLDGGRNLSCVPTGFPQLDKLLGGGMMCGGMYLVAARPGMGKTTLALNIIDRVAQQSGGVLFVSLEMDDDQITAKRLSRLSGIDNMKLMFKRLTETEYAQLAAANDRLLDLPVNINARPTATVEEIKSWARLVNRLSLVVIDYFSLIQDSPGRRSDNDVAVATAKSKAIKLMARELKVPVILLAQLNREIEKRRNKRPILADLRETGALEQDDRCNSGGSMMSVLTIDEARAYARDYESSDEDIQALIDVVDAMIEDGVKANYDRTCPQAKQLARMYVADLTDDHGVSAAQTNTRREVVSSLTLQLRNKTEKAASDADAALEVST